MIIHTMKSILIWFFLFPLVLTKARAQNPFLAIKYDSVVKYTYSPPHDSTYIIDKTGHLNPHVKSSARLDDAEVKDFNIRIGLKESYGGTQAKCFMPHHAFVYYSKGIPVADIVVCLSCNYFVPGLIVPAQKEAKWKGMSHEFKQYVSNLARK